MDAPIANGGLPSYRYTDNLSLNASAKLEAPQAIVELSRASSSCLSALLVFCTEDRPGLPTRTASF